MNNARSSQLLALGLCLAFAATLSFAGCAGRRHGGGTGGGGGGGEGEGEGSEGEGEGAEGEGEGEGTAGEGEGEGTAGEGEGEGAEGEGEGAEGEGEGAEGEGEGAEGEGEGAEGEGEGAGSCRAGQTRPCPGGVEEGECRAGTQSCTAGAWGACSGQVSPSGERCDARDNDCDGETDEGDPGGGAACETDLYGPCHDGRRACYQGNLTCRPLQDPVSEVCGDLVDNDCDGAPDDDCPAPPPCAAGRALQLGAQQQGTLTGSGQASGSCGGGSTGEQVFSFTAPAHGVYSFDTVGSAFDTILYARSRCADAASELGCNDDAGGSNSSSLTFELAAGQQIFLFVDGYDRVGDFALRVTLPTECGNGSCEAGESCDGCPTDCGACVECGDGLCSSPQESCDQCPQDCPCDGACAAVQTVGAGTFVGRTSGSGLAQGSCAGGGAAGEAVFLFVAPAAGTWIFSTATTPWDTVIYLRRGCGEGETDLICNDDYDGGASQVLWDLEFGATVYVFVDGYGPGSVGDFTLNIHQ